MKHNFPGGRRPQTMIEWKSYIDGLSRYERDQLYPGMHKDLIPATEIINAMGPVGNQHSGPDATTQATNNTSTVQSSGGDVTATVRSLVASAASALQQKAPELRSLASKVANAVALSESEKALVTLLRQNRVKGASAIGLIASTCDQASSALNKPGLRFIDSNDCPRQEPMACAEVGGYEVRLTDEFRRSGSQRKISALVHEGVHLAGYGGHSGPRGAEAVEAAVFPEHHKPYTQP